MTSAALATEPTASASGTEKAAGRSFRPDIEGLRAFAVLSVLIYHLNSAWLPGGFAGVDVFFVISGFLITSHLRGEIVRTGSLSLTRFYGRRIARLLPASTIVLVATAAATVVFAPRFVWSQFGWDTAYAGAYGLNWMLAARSVDYLAEDSVPSAVQHYWSLGVEEQFYLLWPLLLLGLVTLAVRRSRSAQAALPIAAGVIVVASFGYAAVQVAIGTPSAYFVTTTRLWELGIGAVVALTLARITPRLTTLHRTVLMLLGLLALFAAVVLLTGTGWPAWPALLPTLGAAAVIIGGGGPTAISKLLGLAPLVWIGGISYGIYLWHWPLITIAHFRWDDFSGLQTAAIVVASVALAWASRVFIEDPIRFSAWIRGRRWRPFGLAAVCLLLSIGAGLGLVVNAPSSSLIAPPGAQPRGAAVLPAQIDLVNHQPWSAGVAWVLPSPLDALQDVPVAYRDGCQQNTTSAEPITCSYGDPQATRTLALVGDSKALQWLPALNTWAVDRGYRLITFVKSSCPYSSVAVDLGDAPYPSCAEWSEGVTQRLVELRPALVVTSQVRQQASATLGDPETAKRLMVEGLQRSWQRLLAADVPVVVLADTPQTGTNVYACVGEHPEDLDLCAYDRVTAVARSAAVSQAAAVRALGGSSIDASGRTGERGTESRLTLIDLTDAVCPDAVRCPPVVGNVLIYRSGSHLTKTYVDSLAPRLGGLLDRSI